MANAGAEAMSMSEEVWLNQLLRLFCEKDHCKYLLQVDQIRQGCLGKIQTVGKSSGIDLVRLCEFSKLQFPKHLELRCPNQEPIQ